MLMKVGSTKSTKFSQKKRKKYKGTITKITIEIILPKIG